MIRVFVVQYILLGPNHHERDKVMIVAFVVHYNTEAIDLDPWDRLGERSAIVISQRSVYTLTSKQSDQ